MREDINYQKQGRDIRKIYTKNYANIGADFAIRFIQLVRAKEGRNKMSNWSYINGVITVEPLGRTQPEKRYILDTVLDHLPRVSGSEGDMDVYVNQKKGYNSSCSADEFGYVTNNLVDSYGDKTRKGGWLRTQDTYLVVVNASLRDMEFLSLIHI